MPSIIFGSIRIGTVESGGIVCNGDVFYISPKTMMTVSGGGGSVMRPVGDHHSYNNSTSTGGTASSGMD